MDRNHSGLKHGCGVTMIRNYNENGTATRFAALNTGNSEVFGLCQERRRDQEWLKRFRLLRVVDIS